MWTSRGKHFQTSFAWKSSQLVASCLRHEVAVSFVSSCPRILLVSNPKSAMLAACMDVATSLVSGFPLDVTNKLRALDFLPTTQPDEGTVMTHVSYTRGHFYRAGVLGRLVVNEERPAASFPLLRSYLRFLLSLIATGCKVYSYFYDRLRLMFRIL